MGDGKVLKTEKNLVPLDTCMDSWCHYYRSDVSPKYRWGPLGKDGIGTNPLGTVDAAGLKGKCNQPKCTGDACDTSWQSKFDIHGRKFRKGLNKIGGFFKKGASKVKNFFRNTFRAEMDWEDYMDYYYGDDDDEMDLYEELLSRWYDEIKDYERDLEEYDDWYYNYYIPEWRKSGRI